MANTLLSFWFGQGEVVTLGYLPSFMMKRMSVISGQLYLIIYYTNGLAYW